LLHQHFQLVKLGVAGCKVARQWRLVSRVELDQSQSRDLPSMVSSSCLR
jgi:hypothetical protein